MRMRALLAALTSGSSGTFQGRQSSHCSQRMVDPAGMFWAIQRLAVIHV